MWIITTNGFLSVVQNENAKVPHEALLVRGRVREDLEHFANFVACHHDRPAVARTPHSDYGYRLTTSREMLASYLAERVGALNYPNFKDEVARVDSVRAYVYARVWDVLRGLRKIGAKGENVESGDEGDVQELSWKTEPANPPCSRGHSANHTATCALFSSHGPIMRLKSK